VELVVDGEQTLFEVDPAGTITSGDRRWRVHPIAADEGVLRLEVDDLVHEAAVRIGAHRVDIAHLGNTFTFERPDTFGPGGSQTVAGDTLLAPMPGTMLSVSVHEGQDVEEGEVLGVMEAMKMELSLKAPMAGAVVTVGAAAGDQVAIGATLFVVKPSDVIPDGSGSGQKV
jgi:acetyl/propionyl-CoA carboxylase alpha subunit